MTDCRDAPGKDVKKLRADAAAACPGLSEVALDALVPPKASVSHQKLANRAVVFSIADGEPLFFEVGSRLGWSTLQHSLTMQLCQLHFWRTRPNDDCSSCSCMHVSP